MRPIFCCTGRGRNNKKRIQREKINNTYLSLKEKNVVTTYNSIDDGLEMDPSKCLLTCAARSMAHFRTPWSLSLDEMFECEPLIDLSYDLPCKVHQQIKSRYTIIRPVPSSLFDHSPENTLDQQLPRRPRSGRGVSALLKKKKNRREKNKYRHHYQLTRNKRSFLNRRSSLGTHCRWSFQIPRWLASKNNAAIINRPSGPHDEEDRRRYVLLSFAFEEEWWCDKRQRRPCLFLDTAGGRV